MKQKNGAKRTATDVAKETAIKAITRGMRGAKLRAHRAVLGGLSLRRLTATIPCCICGKPTIQALSSNPAPVKTGDNDRCCRECNESVVLPARFTRIAEKPKAKADHSRRTWRADNSALLDALG